MARNLETSLLQELESHIRYLNQTQKMPAVPLSDSSHDRYHPAGSIRDHEATRLEKFPRYVLPPLNFSHLKTQRAMDESHHSYHSSLTQGTPAPMTQDDGGIMRANIPSIAPNFPHNYPNVDWRQLEKGFLRSSGSSTQKLDSSARLSPKETSLDKSHRVGRTGSRKGYRNRPTEGKDRETLLDENSSAPGKLTDSGISYGTSQNVLPVEDSAWHRQLQGASEVHTVELARFSVEDQVADILSTFNNGQNTQTSYLSDPTSGFQDPHRDLSLSSLLTSESNRSLPATIYGLAVSNPAFFNTLRQAVPPEYCAISFFKRIERQVYYICNRHSEFLFAGPSAFEFSSREYGMGNREETLADDEEMCLPDEKWCERALRRRVSIIRRHIQLRKPLGQEAKEQALKALLRILWEVVEKGGNQDDDTNLGDTTSRDMNLGRREKAFRDSKIGIYRRLIGNAEVSRIRPPGGIMYSGATLSASCSQLGGFDDGFFIVSVLWELLDAIPAFSGKLRSILGKIRHYGAHPGYIEEFERVLLEAAKVNVEGGSPPENANSPDFWGAGSRRGSEDSVKRARGLSSSDPDRPASRRRVT